MIRMVLQYYNIRILPDFILPSSRYSSTLLLLILRSSHTLGKCDTSLRIILSSYYTYTPLIILCAPYYGSVRICCSHFVALVHNLLHLFTFCCNLLNFSIFCLDFVGMSIILCSQMKNFKCSLCWRGKRN